MIGEDGTDSGVTWAWGGASSERSDLQSGVLSGVASGVVGGKESGSVSGSCQSGKSSGTPQLNVKRDSRSGNRRIVRFERGT